MLYNYIALAFFAIVATLVPASIIIASKLLGKKDKGNPIRNAPYESAEESVGSAKDIDNEYLPLFSIFLPFEVIVGIIIVWSLVAYSIPYAVDIGVVALGVLSAVTAMFGYRRMMA